MSPLGYIRLMEGMRRTLIWVQVAGLVLLLAGLGLGFVGLTDCGSAFAPDYSQAQINDVLNVGRGEAECRDTVGDMRLIAFGALALGAFTTLAASVALLATKANSPTPAA